MTASRHGPTRPACLQESHASVEPPFPFSPCTQQNHPHAFTAFNCTHAIALAAIDCGMENTTHSPNHPPCTMHLPRSAHPRRTVLLSLAPLLGLSPLLITADGSSITDALKTELSLWRQEFDFYRRRLPRIVQPEEELPLARAKTAASEGDAPRIDPKLAAFLLALPLDVIEGSGDERSNSGQISSSSSQTNSSGGQKRLPLLPGWSRSKYEADFKSILRQELPYARSAGICGRCGGSPNGQDDLSDPGKTS